MTALTDEQLAQLRVHATAAALTYHDQVLPEGERVDLAASFAVHGDLRLVAADVLEAACLHVQGRPGPEQTGAVKKIKLGALEIERAAPTTAASDQNNATAWCERAARLRKQAESRAGLIRSPVATMHSSNSEPVFCVTQDRAGP